MHELYYLILLVGKSGSGKTTVANYLEDNYKMNAVQSYTTRKPRYEGETGHTFITYDEYMKLPNKVATTYFDEHYYCATQEQCETSYVYVIDPHGVQSFKNNYDGNKPYKIVYLDVDWFTRLKRMIKRGDSFVSAMKRIIHDRKAFEDFEKNKDVYVIKSKNFDSVITQIYYNCIKKVGEPV